MTTVELRGVGHAYPDGHRAVADVDLAVGDGELVVLVGPSGCGKTTVLRMIAGLEHPTEGEILIDGERVGHLATHRRDLAMLFQSSALYPHMSVRTNLGFPLKMAGVQHAEIRHRVAEVARRLAITDLLDSRPSRLSGGQRQRVAMGRAIVRDPALLLMDEPMSNLDAKLRTELRADIAEMQDALGITTIYVTHDQVEAMALGDRIAVMRDGRVVQCGRPMDLYRRPVDLFVGRFIGVPPMNALLAVVEVDSDGSDGPALRLGPDSVALGERWRARLAGHDGRQVVVGVRPDGLRIDATGGLGVEVVAVERVGSDRFVHATIGVRSVDQPADRPVVADAPSSTVVVAAADEIEVSQWKPVRLAVDQATAQLFDLATGERIDPS